MVDLNTNTATAFIHATKNRYRWHTKIGNITVEELWCLGIKKTGNQITCLSEIALSLKNEIDAKSDEMKMLEVLGETSPQDESAYEMLDIVMFIIQHKKQEADETTALSKKKAMHDTIRQIILAKEEESLQSLDIAALREMLKD